MQKVQALRWEGDRGSYLCVTLRASKPSLGPAACVVLGSYLGLSEPCKNSEPSELMCKQGTEEPDGL